MAVLLFLAPLGFSQSWISTISATTTNNTAVITWTTAVPATSQIKYGVNNNYGKHSALDPALVTSHTAVLKSLSAGTLYYFRILSGDSTSVLVTSLSYTFTTQPGPVAVTISPSTATVTSGGTQQFSAQVQNSDNQSVTWSATAGTVSATGLFTAPSVTSDTTVTMTATSIADPSKSGYATITVRAPMATLSANPVSLSFGNVQVGSVANLSETLTNTGSAAVTISQANVTGAGFSTSGLTLPVSLNAGQSVTLTVKFSPASAGTVNGTLAIVSNASNSPLNVPLSGTGLAQGQLSVSPATLNFGNVVVGTAYSLNGNLTASGASVTVSSASSNSSEFVLSGISLPQTISAGQSTPFTVTFTPPVGGTANATVSFTSNASNSPTAESLAGTGTPPASHSVDLTWNASPGAVGYNLYRSSVHGSSYSKINTTLDSSLTYTDQTVSGGQTYYYVATAVDGNQLESGYSNEATVPVPGP